MKFDYVRMSVNRYISLILFTSFYFQVFGEIKYTNANDDDRYHEKNRGEVDRASSMQVS